MPRSGKPTCTLLFILTLSLLALYTTHLHHRHPPSSAAKITETPSSITGTHSSPPPATIPSPPTSATSPSVLTSPEPLSPFPPPSTNGTVLPIPLSEPSVAGNDIVMPYHAYSPSGAAYGEAVFLNYGREQDYRALGVEVKGCVGLVRRGSGMSRHEVVASAAAHGVSAVLMYTEGEFKEGVERGTVMNGLGDPLSPGWAGIDGGEKLDLNDPRVTEKFPGVPSLPVSEAAAESILASLEGARVPYEWRESFKSGARRIRRVGPGPILLNFTYEGELKMATIHNVFAVIKGSDEPDRGTAALLDIARRFALLMRLGWNPRRTIVLCCWDAEEFGMVGPQGLVQLVGGLLWDTKIGSTEWVEQNLVNLGSKAVAYLNVDCAAQGPGLFISATPQLDDLLVEVKDPDSENARLYERWTAANNGVDIQRLSRVDSDFAPFLQHVGVPSVDLYFGSDFPVYHTAFDSYDWMINFGDPLFQRHVAVAGIWGLVALHLADDPILPFNYLSYATELQEYKNVLNTLLEETISLHPIAAAIQEFIIAANETEEEIKKLRLNNNLDQSTVLRRRMLNDRLMLTERGFLDLEGSLEGNGSSIS
ncbi:hypothetical protein DH2020_039693 [Rehmannia glutinosa]|uniref:Uncharacterized protein n=1 Tax=Rehmannia glutinosa TaxID=99300 RepID=A0ABR0UWW3_REHGL